MTELVDHLSSEQLLYATVWEDEELLCDALAITPDDDVISICSAGCNVLALLAAGARTVTAVDLNPVQLALLELKLAGIRRLSYRELAELVGEAESAQRWELYQHVRSDLSPGAQRIWDARRAVFEEGIVRTGRLERYFGDFAMKRLPKFWDPQLAYDIVDCGEPGPRMRLLAERGNLANLRDVVRDHFGAQTMARDGRSEAQLKHAGEMDVGREQLQRFARFIAEKSWTRNHYLERLLTGKLRSPELGPAYLQPAVFERLRSRVDAVKLVHGDLQSTLEANPHGTFSKANLSDLFEYLSETESNELFSTLEQRLRENGRMAYWNLLVPRVAKPQHGRLETLHAGPSPKDRVFFYGAFVAQRIGG